MDKKTAEAIVAVAEEATAKGTRFVPVKHVVVAGAVTLIAVGVVFAIKKLKKNEELIEEASEPAFTPKRETEKLINKK